MPTAYLLALEASLREAAIRDGIARLPFDLSRVVEDIRHERYAAACADESFLNSVSNWAYYAVRPLLSVAVRKHLQHLYLRGWEKKPFPQWPVDRTVDRLLEQSLLLSLRASGVDRIPFVWFWPDGAPSCAIMTHDVETGEGRDFCSTLMDIDDAFGIKASFMVVPELRYEVTPSYLKSITGRGFELGVQDLNHDGRLYSDRQQFMARAAKINSYGREWEAEGFRGAVLYRKQDWFDALDFSYDMSVPNVAHLDPQHGGCCTVMPYFVGNILELPVTATQDYTLFHILKDYSIDLWKQQAEFILEANGLMGFIVHPDYILGEREQSIYESLLAHLAELREQKGIWISTPNEVNNWWRLRSKMEIIEGEDGLRISGAGSERARIAYARSVGEGIELTLEGRSAAPKLHSSVVGNMGS